MAGKVEHKRGDTYKITVVLTEADGVTPINITGWTIKSQVRLRSTLITTLLFTMVDAANGEFTLTAEDTTQWPIRPLFSDIEYIDAAGVVRSSETYTISVIGDVTYD